MPFFSTNKTMACSQISANETVFSSLTREDESFFLTMSATSRSNSDVFYQIQTKKNSLENDVTYVCFNWSDLQRLDFKINSHFIENAVYDTYAFNMTYVRSEYLENAPSFGNSKTEELSKDSLAQNPFTRLDLHFYEDSDMDIQLDNYSFLGHDFGLYKFDFTYSYSLNDEISSRSLGEIIVAILPDDIDKISAGEVPTIVYSRSSSNALLNVFNCSLSLPVFKYVNPDHIQWIAYGTDIYNTRYCLTQQLVEDESMDFANYLPMWQSYDNTGLSFVLDTNEIEGTWNVRCIVRNSDGTEKYLQPIVVEGLSTVKIQPPDRTWLILLVVFVCVAVLVVVSLLFTYIMKKHEKVW